MSICNRHHNQHLHHDQGFDLTCGRVYIQAMDGVMPPSPYSLFLANRIPDLRGEVVADIGSGSGILAIAAALSGARQVYAADNNLEACAATEYNARRNGVSSRVTVLPVGDMFDSFTSRMRLDTIICNPASLPMPFPDRQGSPYFAGPLGRWMIERLICEAPVLLNPHGRLLMTHTTLADWPASEALFGLLGYEIRVLDTMELNFRPLYDRKWLDRLDGQHRRLYFMRASEPYEEVHVISARTQRAAEEIHAEMIMDAVPRVATQPERRVS